MLHSAVSLATNCRLIFHQMWHQEKLMSYSNRFSCKASVGTASNYDGWTDYYYWRTDCSCSIFSQRDHSFLIRTGAVIEFAMGLVVRYKWVSLTFKLISSKKKSVFFCHLIWNVHQNGVQNVSNSFRMEGLQKEWQWGKETESFHPLKVSIRRN